MKIKLFFIISIFHIAFNYAMENPKRQPKNNIALIISEKIKLQRQYVELVQKNGYPLPKRCVIDSETFYRSQENMSQEEFDILQDIEGYALFNAYGLTTNFNFKTEKERIIFGERKRIDILEQILGKISSLESLEDIISTLQSLTTDVSLHIE